MFIKKLQIDAVRVIEQASLELDPGINLITGNNGAGKTSILESIYLLGRGKSFRHAEAGPLIRKDYKTCQLLAQVFDENTNKLQHLGMIRGTGEAVVRFAGEKIRKRSELLKILPLHLITPASHALVEDTPDIRRRFLDHGLFHVEHDYHAELSEYYRVLKQRNAALRQRDIRLIRSFDQQMIELGESLNTVRSTYVKKLEVELIGILETLDMPFIIALKYQQGWDSDKSLQTALAMKLDKDLDRGFTSVGPQRANIKISSDGAPAAKHLSRGQQKVLVYALKLAECRILVAETGIKPLFLIDDIAAELDSVNLQKILLEIAGLGLQTFITAVAKVPIPDDLHVKLFHVEHGDIKVVD